MRVCIYLFIILQIFEFGVITFGEIVTSCPPTPRDFDELPQTVIAVYWIPAQVDDNDSGSEIFFRMILANETEFFNKTEVEGFIEEINITRNESLVFSDVESVIYITWVNLKQLPGTLAEVSVNYVSFIF